MKRALAFCLVGVVTVIGVAAMMLYSDNRSEIDRIISPDRNYFIVNFQSNDEGGHAPYGNELVIFKSKSKAYRDNGHVIFAGYCFKGISYRWVDSKSVEIVCSTSSESKLVTLSKRVFGIDIRYIQH